MKDYQFSAEVTALTQPNSTAKWMVVIRREVIDHNFMWSDDLAEKFATRIDALTTPLLESNRNMGPIVFSFGNTKCMIISLSYLRIAFVIQGNSTNLDDLAARSLALLHRYEESIYANTGTARFVATVKPEPEPEVEKVDEEAVQKALDDEWQGFRKFLESVLGKLMAERQASDIVLGAKEKNSPAAIPAREQFAAIGAQVLSYVPHRAKKSALQEEINEYLTTPPTP